MFAGLVVAPIAAFAADTPDLGGLPSSKYTFEADPDGAGLLFTLKDDASVYTTITMPNDATLDGAGHQITAVEDATHPSFQGPVVASAVGGSTAPAKLDVKNLDITTSGFQGGNSSGDLFSGIYMYRAGGSLTHVSVNGISHGNGNQQGSAISIRNRVAGDDINVPRAQVALTDIDVTNYQKTGLLLDGNLTFSVKNARVGQGAGPEGQPNPIIAANSLQISRGASGSVTDSTFKLNSHAQATAALLYNAKKVDFDRVTIDGSAPASVGINVSNVSNTIETSFTMRGGAVTGTATASDSVGVAVSGNPGTVSATLIDTKISGWGTLTEGEVTTTTTPVTTPTAPAVVKVDVAGKYHASRPQADRLRIVLSAFALGANQAEGSMLRWTIKVDGHRAAAIRQHAGDSDVWAQTFRAGTGTHTVQILKNGVSQRTFKVRTR